MLKILKAWFIEVPIQMYKGVRDAEGIKNKLFLIFIFLFVFAASFGGIWFLLYSIYQGITGDDTEMKFYAISLLIFILSILLYIPFLYYSELLKKKDTLSSKYAYSLSILPMIPTVTIGIIYYILYILGLLAFLFYVF